MVYGASVSEEIQYNKGLLIYSHSILKRPNAAKIFASRQESADDAGQEDPREGADTGLIPIPNKNLCNICADFGARQGSADDAGQ